LSGSCQSSNGTVTCGTAVTNFASCGGCGTERWPVKVGTDSTNTMVNLNYQLTTVASLVALPTETTTATTRQYPPELQTYEIKNVKVTYTTLESDGDYHIAVQDTTGAHMVTEIPCPSCATGSLFYCNITHARAAYEATATKVGDTVTIIGIGMYDPPHGQNGAAVNNLELHPILMFCDGQDCTPN
jgi:hypothetical protein